MAEKRSDIQPDRDSPEARHGAIGPRSGREAALSAIHLGHVYLESDSYSDAIEYFKTAQGDALRSELTGAELAALYASVARCYLGLGEHDKAREYAERVQGLDIGDEEATARAEADVVLAKVEARSGRFEESLAAAQRAYAALRSRPDSPLLAEASKVLGTAHAELGDTTAARDNFVDSLVCNKRLGNDSGVAGAYNNLGILAKRSGDLIAAVECFEQALEIDKRLAKPGSIARRLNNLGVALYRLSRWTEAEEHLTRALEIYSRLGATRDVVAVQSALGNVCRVRRRWGEARRYFEAVLQTSSEAGYRRSEALALEFLGDLEKDQGNYDEALGQLDRALACARRLSSNSDVVGEVLRRRAEVLLALGRPEEAERDCTEALELCGKIGDRLEEGATLRVLAAVSYAKRERAVAEALAGRAEEILRRTGESFELAKTALIDAIGQRESSPPDELPLERIEAKLASAEALFARIEADYWVARCRLERARALFKAGQPGRTRPWLEKARPALERARDGQALAEVDGLLERLDSELAAVGTVPPSGYSVIAEGYRFLRSGQPDVEALHRFASWVAEVVTADRLVLFSLEPDGTPVIATSVGRTGRRLAEVKRLIRSAAGGPRPISPLVAGGGSANGVVAPGVAAVVLIPVDLSGEGDGEYVLYADRLGAPGVPAFSARDIEFVGAAARMLTLVHSAAATSEGDTLATAESEGSAPPEVITRDPKMMEIVTSATRLRGSGIPVLIVGESGVGKEVLARTIHKGGRSLTGRFVALNSGAIPPHLQESELFGHVKGAFTDADRDREGLIEAAIDGTLFLDEIGEMSQALQVKLLRFLQNGEYRRVGESSARKSNARVISASNRDLRQEVAAGRFRQDLFYRLSALIIEMPPLRDRSQDIPLLMDHFLEVYSELEEKRIRGFSREVRDLFLRYDWRGNNVRELENEVRRAVALCDDGGIIGVEELGPELRAQAKRILCSVSAGAAGSMTLKDEVEALERSRIHEALEMSGHSKRKAAKRLGLSRTGLYTKLKKYGMD